MLKRHQHDADLDHGCDDPESMDPDEAWAGAVAPEVYILSSPEAWASAVEQVTDGE